MQIRYNSEENQYTAADMSSKHGVFINGKRITEEATLVDGDEILIGQTRLLFTEKDFDDRESALSHYKKVGERSRPTRIE
jgi:pSer/pThr/pTyr-binding forkhead associated (FHA) protein